MKTYKYAYIYAIQNMFTIYDNLTDLFKIEFKYEDGCLAIK